jgi:hypothetical protein
LASSIQVLSSADCEARQQGYSPDEPVKIIEGVT